MPFRDLQSGLGALQAMGPATYSSTQASGASINLQPFDSALFLISVGAGGITFDANNRIDIVVEASTDNGTTWNAVSQSDVQSYGNAVTVASGGIVRTLNSVKAAADTAPTKVGYIGSAKNVRARPVFTGTHGTGTPISIVAIGGHSHQRPVA